MALVSVETGHTRSFRACAVYRTKTYPVLPIDSHGGKTCPDHGGTDCVATYYSGSDLASMTWWQMWWQMWRLRRHWRRTNP